MDSLSDGTTRAANSTVAPCLNNDHYHRDSLTARSSLCLSNPGLITATGSRSISHSPNPIDSPPPQSWGIPPELQAGGNRTGTIGHMPSHKWILRHRTGGKWSEVLEGTDGELINFNEMKKIDENRLRQEAKQAAVRERWWRWVLWFMVHAMLLVRGDLDAGTGRRYSRLPTIRSELVLLSIQANIM